MSFIHLFTQALHIHSHLLFIQSISVKIVKSSCSRCFDPKSLARSLSVDFLMGLTLVDF